ncbi:hypothetical protein MPER_12897 [Moniliophthora perniciosa FA553]|nr:hypothetical protein MPER_12897 [Moniliophthora perniciosa FA553]
MENLSVVSLSYLMAQLNEDLITSILEYHIWMNGSLGNINVLLIKSSVTPRLYPAFYTNIAMITYKSLIRLRRTLGEHEERIGYVRTLWFRMSFLSGPRPGIEDYTYPAFYQPKDCFALPLNHHHIDDLCDLIRDVVASSS